MVSFHSSVTEEKIGSLDHLEVVHQQSSEVMGAAEELAGDLEGRQSDLSVVLVELRHHRVVQVIDAVVGRSRRRGRGGNKVRIPLALRFTVQCLNHSTALVQPSAPQLKLQRFLHT